VVIVFNTWYFLSDRQKHISCSNFSIIWSCLQWAPQCSGGYAGPWVIFGSISAAAPWEGRIPTQPTLNTSSTDSSGCSHSDRFGSHFKQGRTGRDTWRHMLPSGLLPKLLNAPLKCWRHLSSSFANCWAKSSCNNFLQRKFMENTFLHSRNTSVW